MGGHEPWDGIELHDRRIVKSLQENRGIYEEAS